MRTPSKLSAYSESQERRILIIDDNPAIHEDYRKILTNTNGASKTFHDLEADLFGEEKGETVSAQDETFLLDSAYQGEQGLALVTKAIREKRPYMAAFVDMRMPPGWNGVETIEKIWPVDPEVNIVICSAYSDYPWDEISDRFSHKRKQLLFLSKPFQAIEVRQIAFALTSQWQLAREVNQRREVLESEIENRTQALKTTEHKYRTIFEKMHDAVLLLDRENCAVVDANQQAMVLLGMSPEGIYESSCHTLFPENIQSRIQSAMRDGSTTSEILVEQIKFPKRDQPIDAEISFTKMALGDDSRVLLLIRDVSKRRSLETQLLRSQKLESVGQLAAGVAHEINTPTQYVGDNTQFLLDAFGDIAQVLAKYDRLVSAVANQRDTEKLLKDLHAIIEELDVSYLMEEIPSAINQSMEGIQRVTEIVRALKSFAHPGTGAMAASDINAAILNTITVARNEWKYVAEIETRLDNALPLVECRLGELNQVFLNIIVNAAHAIEADENRKETDKGKITICTAMHDENTVEIRLKDDGPGIPAHVINKVFDPFFTTKEVGKGTGQGLAIAHTVITEMHQGHLFVDSDPGNGACFTIRIPVVAPAESSEGQSAETE